MVALLCCLLCPGEPLPLPSGHDASVVSVAFSPDGKHLVSGDKDGRLIVWDAKTWTVIDVLRQQGYETRVRERDVPNAHAWFIAFDDGKLVWQTRGSRDESSLVRVRDLGRRRNLLVRPPGERKW